MRQRYSIITELLVHIVPWFNPFSGGGSLGCNTLYQLGKLGITDAVILEKDKLTAGTTWHSAGLLWRLRPNDTDIQLIGKTHQVLQEIEEETGIDPG